MPSKKNTSEDVKEPEAKIVKIELTEKEKNNKSLAEGRVTEYTVPANELGHVHVELESVQMNSNFEKTSKPFIQKFDTRAFDSFRRIAKMQGFTHCRVLHAPEGVNTEFIDPSKPKKE